MSKRKVFTDSDSDDQPDEDADSSGSEEEEEEKKLSEDDSSDSDAEPEAVTFANSKLNVLERVRTAIRQIENDRQQLKAKRQKKDAVFKEQKRLKLEKLAKLPQDVLEAVSASSSVDHKQPASKTRPRPTKTADELDIAEQEKTVEGEDFIPLDSSSTVRAVSVKQPSQKSSALQKALEFRHQRAYNSQVLRQPASSFKSRSVKRKVMKAS